MVGKEQTLENRNGASNDLCITETYPRSADECASQFSEDISSQRRTSPNEAVCSIYSVHQDGEADVADTADLFEAENRCQETPLLDEDESRHFDGGWVGGNTEVAVIGGNRGSGDCGLFSDGDEDHEEDDPQNGSKEHATESSDQISVHLSQHGRQQQKIELGEFIPSGMSQPQHGHPKPGILQHGSQNVDVKTLWSRPRVSTGRKVRVTI